MRCFILVLIFLIMSEWMSLNISLFFLFRSRVWIQGCKCGQVPLCHHYSLPPLMFTVFCRITVTRQWTQGLVLLEYSGYCSFVSLLSAPQAHAMNQEMFALIYHSEIICLWLEYFCSLKYVTGFTSLLLLPEILSVGKWLLGYWCSLAWDYRTVQISILSSHFPEFSHIMSVHIY